MRFIPLHCLPDRKRFAIEELLKTELHRITDKASSNPKKLAISGKKQDELGMENVIQTKSIIIIFRSILGIYIPNIFPDVQND